MSTAFRVARPEPSTRTRVRLVDSRDTPDVTRPPRDDMVPRRALLERLRSAADARVLLVSAPAGSGKTSLLRQWAADDPRPVAWIDAAQLRRSMSAESAIALAIERAIPDRVIRDVEWRVAVGEGPAIRGSHGSPEIVLDDEPLTLVVDNLHELHDARAVDAIAGIAEHMPDTWRMALATREPVALPTMRWRTKGVLTELGLTDLAMDAGECRELLRQHGLELPDDVVDAVADRTEGWAAGIYLAALSLKTHLVDDVPARVSGADHLIRSYIEFEVLAGLDVATQEMLVRTSVVDEVSGPLADAIAGTTDAGARLYELSRRNQLVIPVDPTRRWFRYHALLRDLLTRRLEDAAGDTTDAHLRAASWYEAEGRTHDAITHTLRAGDTANAIRLVREAAPAAWRAGDPAAIEGWISAFDTSQLRADSRLTTLAALVSAIEGDAGAALSWAAVSQRPAAQPEPAEDAVDVALLRAVLCRRGPEAMLADAHRTLAMHDDNWTWRFLAQLASGVAHAMLGDDAAAERTFSEAEHAPGISAAMERFAIRAERALAAATHRDWATVEMLLAPDRAAMNANAGDARALSMLWLIADARLAIHRGNVRAVKERLARAVQCRARVSWAMPWYAVRALTELGRAQLLVGDARDALETLGQARLIVEARPRLGALIPALEDVWRRAFTQGIAMLPPGSTLTPAELRLLPLLQTYLTFKEIAERLGISSNTVKTQAMAIYAKLGAGSRSAAIATAVGYGLLEDIFA